MKQRFIESSRIKKIIALAKDNPEVEILLLYGSQARGNANENSDYNLAVAFKSYLQDPFERRLRPELLGTDQSALQFFTDKIDMRR